MEPLQVDQGDAVVGRQTQRLPVIILDFLIHAVDVQHGPQIPADGLILKTPLREQIVR